MVDKRHMEILKKGADEWNSWRKINSHIKPDLFGASLNWSVLSDDNFSDVNFSNTNLSKATLTEIDFSGGAFQKSR